MGPGRCLSPVRTLQFHPLNPIVEGTGIKTNGGSDELGTLSEVEAEAVLEGGVPYVGVEIEFTAKSGAAEFKGRVVAVDTEAGTFTLANGRTYTVPEELEFDEEGTLFSLEAMAGALDAGDVVTVEGTAEKDGETGAWVVSALKADRKASSVECWLGTEGNGGRRLTEA